MFFSLSAGKIPFIHVGNQVVSELGPIVQFTKAKVCLLIVLISSKVFLIWRFDEMLISQGHSLSDGLDDVQRAEMKAYMELVNNMLLTAEVHAD